MPFRLCRHLIDKVLLWTFRKAGTIKADMIDNSAITTKSSTSVNFDLLTRYLYVNLHKYSSNLKLLDYLSRQITA